MIKTPSSSFHNGGFEHGSLGFLVPRLPLEEMRHFSWGGQTKASTSRSQLTLTTHLGMSGLSSSLPAIWSNSSPGGWHFWHKATVFWYQSTNDVVRSPGAHHPGQRCKRRIQPLSKSLVLDPVLCVEVSPITSSCYHFTSCTCSSLFSARKVMFDLSITAVGQKISNTNSTYKRNNTEISSLTVKHQW